MKSFSVCVFCSASQGLPPAYTELAVEFGVRVAREGYRLVYGGGGRGLMGSAARAAAGAGGAVLGVMPGLLARRENLARDLGENIIVDTLAQRKDRMAQASDAFIGLPGGVGTLDEVTEMITWNDLGIHAKPVLLLNSYGFWDPLLEFFRRGREIGVIRQGLERHYSVVPDMDSLFAALEQFAGSNGPAPGADAGAG
jgi:uncharacterized protein (TIGR00730 family)